MLTVAALYVERAGVYASAADVEMWPADRDARLYTGPHPVVAHPPCSRWCVPLAITNATRYGHRVGDDGGCFEAALACVRAHGGVLEHPAHTLAWRHFGLTPPLRNGWVRGCFDEGWVCEVAQSAYMHLALKRTWLYYVGDVPPAPLRWCVPPARALVSHLQRTKSKLPRLSKREAIRTPIAFRDALLELARGAVVAC